MFHGAGDRVGNKVCSSKGCPTEESEAYVGTFVTTALRRSWPEDLSRPPIILWGSWIWWCWPPPLSDPIFACFSLFILSCSSRSRLACSLISFTARSSFFNFILRFWNQILICLSVRQRAWAISILRRLVR